MKHIMKCIACGSYTLKETCACGSKAAAPKPAKFSPEDHYGNYRRQAKQEILKGKGFL